MVKKPACITGQCLNHMWIPVLNSSMWCIVGCKCFERVFKAASLFSFFFDLFSKSAFSFHIVTFFSFPSVVLLFLSPCSSLASLILPFFFSSFSITQYEQMFLPHHNTFMFFDGIPLSCTEYACGLVQWACTNKCHCAWGVGRSLWSHASSSAKCAHTHISDYQAKPVKWGAYRTAGKAWHSSTHGPLTPTPTLCLARSGGSVNTYAHTSIHAIHPLQKKQLLYCAFVLFQPITQLFQRRQEGWYSAELSL